jgi:hypothetical protein
MNEVNPTASLLGNITGGVGGALATGMGGAALAKVAANPNVARLLASPLTADVAFGTVSGATQADDPIHGAALGAASALGGNLIGGQIAKRLPSLVGLRAPVDPLGRGERAVYTAAGRTGPDEVAQALVQAGELGVPAALADVSPDVNSLTGAALRRSPAAAGNAREALATRSRGQYDRFTGAIERDLGPVENIPQRSEDLITQARAAAGPLYESAYNAPGASVVDLSDLMGRPSINRALANARRIVLEEGREPTSLGFDFNEAGDTVLARTPSWRTLDYVKRGLDDVVEGYRDPTTGKLVLDTEGHAVNGTLRDFLSRVDKVNPDYAAARAAYAGPSAEREAMKRGQEAIRISPDQLGVNVSRASPAQADQMRLGFQSSLAENAGRLRNNANPFQATLDTPAMEQRLGTLYPSGIGDVARLLTQRDLERDVASSTNRLIGNSMTAERAVADDAFNGQGSVAGTLAQGALETALTGAPVVTAARSGIGRGVGRAVRDWRELGLGQRAVQLADEIAPLALNMNPEESAAALAEWGSKDAAHQAILQELLKTAASRGGHVGAGTSSGVAASLMR